MPEALISIIGSIRNAVNRKFYSLLLILMFTSAGTISSQNPDDTICIDSVNLTFVENLVRKGIDSVRIVAGLNPLQPDSALMLAAYDHAYWLARQRTISHYQPLAAKSNVQKRAEFYGGSMFLCGENIAASYIDDLMADKSGRTYRNITYRQLADEFVGLWINSASHNTNIINPVYGFTGIGISYHPQTRRIVAVQVFGFRKKKG